MIGAYIEIMIYYYVLTVLLTIYVSLFFHFLSCMLSSLLDLIMLLITSYMFAKAHVISVIDDFSSKNVVFAPPHCSEEMTCD